MDRLFTYGTLMVPEVIEAVLGRPVGRATSAKLPDYGCYRVRDCQYPAILAEAGCVTTGCVYRDLSPTSLKQLDRYEGDLYDRRLVCVQLLDGGSLEVWTYVLHTRHQRLLTQDPWDLDDFVERRLDRFLRILRGEPC